jgi:hypothetical protein
MTQEHLPLAFSYYNVMIPMAKEMNERFLQVKKEEETKKKQKIISKSAEKNSRRNASCCSPFNLRSPFKSPYPYKSPKAPITETKIAHFSSKIAQFIVKKRNPKQTDFSHVTEKAVADVREEQIRNHQVKYVKHMHLKQKSKLIKSQI